MCCLLLFLLKTSNRIRQRLHDLTLKHCLSSSICVVYIQFKNGNVHSYMNISIYICHKSDHPSQVLKWYRPYLNKQTKQQTNIKLLGCPYMNKKHNSSTNLTSIQHWWLTSKTSKPASNKSEILKIIEYETIAYNSLVVS